MTCLVMGLTLASSFSNRKVSLNSSLSVSGLPSMFFIRVNFRLPPRFRSVYTGSSLFRLRETKYGRLGAHCCGGNGSTGSGMSLGDATDECVGCRVG
jgi:hypothetical protein